MDLKTALKRKALELGFVKAGITTTDNFHGYYDPEHIAAYYDFLSKDSRQIPQNAEALEKNFPDAKSILSVIYSYGNTAYPEKLLRHIGRAYLGRCYGPLAGTVNGERIRLLKTYIREKGIRIFDDCFLPDRAAAAHAGCITFGKNNFAYCGEYGSFIIITNLVLDVELAPDTPTIRRECPENCHLCMDACPTGAIEAPGRLCPQKCMGFNQWFRQSEKNVDPHIPEEIRPALGERIHGCDICQEACPRNRKVLSAANNKDPFLEYLAGKFDLEKLLFLEEEYYQDAIHPILYNYIKDYRYLRRNAAIAMGNSGNTHYLDSLEKAAKADDPLLSEAADWAIRRLQETEPS